MRWARSSTTAAVLLEAIRQEHAPAMIITAGVDRFLVLAALVADEMYGRTVAIVSVEGTDFDALLSATRLDVDADGRIVREA